MSGVSPHDGLTLYLNDCSEEPLLDAQDEVALAEAIEAGKEARDALRHNGHHTSDEVAQMEEKVDEGDAARERMIRANMRLVVSMAKRYRGHGVPFLDLIQEGNLGLMKAIDRFDPGRGCRLSTYAHWWIRQAMQEAISEMGSAMRIPGDRQDQIHWVRSTTAQLTKTMGRAPTYEEIADEIANLTEAQVYELAQVEHRRSMESLDRPLWGDEEERSLGDFVEDPSPSVEDVAEEQRLRERVRALLERLPARERRVLEMRFGVGRRAYTAREVSEQEGVSVQYVRQTTSRALRRLRLPAQGGRLWEFLS